jgi:hypothetical protein
MNREGERTAAPAAVKAEKRIDEKLAEAHSLRKFFSAVLIISQPAL